MKVLMLTWAFLLPADKCVMQLNDIIKDGSGYLLRNTWGCNRQLKSDTEAFETQQALDERVKKLKQMAEPVGLVVETKTKVWDVRK